MLCSSDNILSLKEEILKILLQCHNLKGLWQKQKQFLVFQWRFSWNCVTNENNSQVYICLILIHDEKNLNDCLLLCCISETQNSWKYSEPYLVGVLVGKLWKLHLQTVLEKGTAWVWTVSWLPHWWPVSRGHLWGLTVWVKAIWVSARGVESCPTCA